MFNLEPISTTNLFTLLQALIILVGFFFSWKSLEAARASIHLAAQNLGVATTSLNTASANLQLATANAQAQLYNQMILQGRDLQFRFMELYFGNDINAKQDMFLGTLIGYYSACFELRTLLNLPESVVKLLDNDFRKLLEEDRVRRKWEQVRNLHSGAFVDYVNRLPGVR
jgi:hypothetical protein